MGDRHPQLETHTALRGRERECGALDGLLDTVRGGRSAVKVLRGAPGIGKTALLRYVTQRATDFTVGRCVGVESEMELAFAGLHDLCSPLLSHLDSLVEPQRQALGVALGLASGERPEPFVVALATLSLLSEASAAQPVLCAVDDVQWLDHATAQVLGFVGRRLLAEAVAVVLTARTSTESPDPLAGLPELLLSGLDEQSATALLASVTRAPVDESVRSRVLEECRGNPLALLELGTGLGAVDFAGGFALPDTASVPQRIQAQYLTQLHRLPAQAQRLVLLAAADPVGDWALLQRAALIVGLDIDAAQLAVEAGLLDIGARVRFRHPLLRSAVYRTAEVEDRRVAHAALAEATDRQLDPDRRAWHRAYAAGVPDEEVAVELITSADRAQHRGGLAAAAAFWERAVVLTPDPGRRAQRALVAAEEKYAAGDFVASQKLLAAADIGPLDELGHARVDRMRGQVAFRLNRGGDAPSLLMRAAQRLEPLDGELSRETFLDALVAGIYAGRLAVGAPISEVAYEAKSAAGGPEPPLHRHLLLKGLALRLLDGEVVAAPLLTEALRQYRAREQKLDSLCHPFYFVAAELWDDEAWFELTSGHVRLARASGSLSWLSVAMGWLALFYVQAGEFARSQALVSEQEGIEPGMTEPTPFYGTLMLAAWRGDTLLATELADQMIHSASRRGEELALTYAEYMKAVLYNGLGRYELAAEAAQNASSAPTSFIAHWALPELVEAAVRTNQPQRADDAAQRLSAIAAAGGTTWLQGAAACARAQVTGDHAANDLYQQAITLLRRTRLTAHLARVRLCYGEWLRRTKHRADARIELRQSFDALSAMGANGFADRARRELQATGGRVRKDRGTSDTELTPQEEQVAQLARARHSSAEIGAELYLSARTVDWHLANIFTKLDIKNRRQLDAALRSRATVALGQH